MAAAKKKETAPETDPPPDAPETTASSDESAPDSGPGEIAVDEQFADSSGPATPVSHIQVRGANDEPVKARSGGHVLTDRGWVLER